PAGCYQISASITIGNAMTLYGDGSGAIVTGPTTSSCVQLGTPGGIRPSYFAFWVSGIPPVQFKDFLITGSTTPANNSAGAIKVINAGSAGGLFGNLKSRIENMQFLNIPNGVDWQGQLFFTMDKNTWWNMGPTTTNFAVRVANNASPDQGDAS